MKKRLYCIGLAAILVMSSLSGCQAGNGNNRSENPGKKNLTADAALPENWDASWKGNMNSLGYDEQLRAIELGEASNRFGSDVFRSVISERGDSGNTFFSPYSLSSALISLTCGMPEDSATGLELKEKMYLLDEEGNSVYDMDTIAEGTARLNMLLQTNDSARVDIANSFWMKPTLPLSERFSEYASRLKMMGEEGYTMDEDGETCRKEINRWANEKTNGMIPEAMIYPPQGEFVLVNATYFLGEWENEFKEENTTDRIFYGAAEEKEGPMMYKEDSLNYMSSDGICGVQIPYKDGEYYMNVFMSTDEKTSIGDMLRDENADQKKWYSEIFGYTDADWRTAEVRLTLPRFEIDDRIDLKPVLNDCGIEKVFNDAGMELLTDEKMHLEDIFQVTKIKTDEAGSEAAAVTVVDVRMESIIIESDETVEFTVDHPFFFTIEDGDTGTILFEGLVNTL